MSDHTLPDCPTCGTAAARIALVGTTNLVMPCRHRVTVTVEAGRLRLEVADVDQPDDMRAPR